MSFLKFKIIAKDPSQTMGHVFLDVLFNEDHIVSIKPINIILNDEIVKGYWIRMTNGKKYRASEIPEQLKELLGREDTQIPRAQEVEETPLTQ